MNTYLNVARYHLVDRYQYTALPVGVTLLSFLVNLVVFTLVPDDPDAYYSGGQLAIYVFLFVLGSISVSRSLPFGFALGLTRRDYYVGTMMFVGVVAAAYGLGVALLQLIEGATTGWGLDVHFFRIPWFLDGPWYLTWLTSFVLLVLMFTYGMWYGLIYRRWNITGTVVFAACQVVVVLAALATITWTDAWSAVGRFFVTLGSTSFTGLLAALAAVLIAGGYTTIRRITV